MEKFLADNIKFYNKNLFSYKGRINRLNYFINTIIINLFCILVVTIPIAMILHIFNTKKRFFDITESNFISWISVFLFHALSFIACCIFVGYSNSDSFAYNQDTLFVIAVIILFLSFITGVLLIFMAGKHKPVDN